jgi:predicted esterase
MAHRTYQSVARAARELASSGDPIGAVDLLSREAPAFPLHTAVAALARAKLLGQLGEVDRALACLEGALDAGYRLRNEWLQDPELAMLATDSRFADLTARAARTYALAMVGTKPELRVIQPRELAPAAGYPLLVVLHGNGSNIELSAQYWRPAAELGWLLALAQSSEVGSAPGTYLWAGRERAASELATHMATLRAGFRIAERHVVLAGFSGGATHALALTLTSLFTAQGVIAIGSYLPVIDEFTRRVQGGAASALRVYFVVGEEDESGYVGSKRLAEVFATHAVPVRLEAHADLGHEYPPDMSVTLRSALSFLTDVQ